MTGTSENRVPNGYTYWLGTGKLDKTFTELWRPFSCPINVHYDPQAGWVGSRYPGRNSGAANVTSEGDFDLFGHRVSERPGISVWDVRGESGSTDFFDDSRQWTLTKCELVWQNEAQSVDSAASGAAGQGNNSAPVATLYGHYACVTTMDTVGSIPAGEAIFLRSSICQLGPEAVDIFGTKDVPREVVYIPVRMVDPCCHRSMALLVGTRVGSGCWKVGEQDTGAEPLLDWSLRACSVTKMAGLDAGHQDVTLSGYVNVVDRMTHEQAGLTP